MVKPIERIKISCIRKIFELIWLVAVGSKVSSSVKCGTGADGCGWHDGGKRAVLQRAECFFPCLVYVY
jgi:hypothetical protein